MKPELEIWLGDDIQSITKSDIRSPFTDLHGASAVWTISTNSGVTDMYLYSNHVQGLQPTQPRIRFFGWKTANLPQSQNSERLNIWSAPMAGSLVRSCAQEIFASFLTSILDIVDSCGDVYVEEGESIRLENGLVSEIVALFTEMQLGSKLEAQLCVIPLLLPRLGVPSAASALAAAKDSANHHRKRKNWVKAEKVLQWAWNICRRSQNSYTHVIDEGEDNRPGSEDKLVKQATIDLCELYRWALIEKTSRTFGIYGICWLHEKCGQSVSEREVIDRYFLVANEFSEHQASDADLDNMETGSLKTALLFVTHPASETTRVQKGIALCLAAEYKWAEVALALLELGGEPEFRDAIGRVPLSHAAESGSITIVEDLMKWGSFPDSEDYARRTPLSYASELGRHEVVELLLRDVRVSPDPTDNYHETPLSWAAQNGHDTVVKLLLETGKVEPDRRDQYERTPLSHAAENGHDSVVKLLLESGKVKQDINDHDKRTPLYM
ncbi:uncharacterized protein PGRI_053270 [Penicillium griseofulvum]|uniref:Uncharacterized protein n=1 Tax=Penicillium patulum TaxID=5078 RepID=A0A135LBW4_PENPA|nr:uncharacterized protein PGRI_053270 [Penicillium griseofulvum]KXG46471.1 hypothetical protein PGRI_053270 [Penicillium griseofulvum]